MLQTKQMQTLIIKVHLYMIGAVFTAVMKIPGEILAMAGGDLVVLAVIT